MKRTILFLMTAAILALSALTACSSGGAAVQETKATGETAATEPEATETERIYPKYEADYDGAEFNMLYFDAVANCGWSDSIPCDIYVEELNGDLLSDAVYQRNLKLEELYNIDIVASGRKGSTDTTTEIQKQVLSGTPTYDVMFPCQTTLYTLILDDLIADLTEEFDYTLPWYDPKGLEAFSILGKTYAVVTDATYMDKMLSIVILFNSNMTQSLNLGDLYQMVLDHEWDFDAMLEMCEAVGRDVDGNGVMDKNDVYGILSQNDAVYELLHASGNRYVTINRDGVPEITLDRESTVSTIQKIYSFMNRTELFFNRQKSGASTIDVCNMFANDQGLFILRQIQCAFELRNMTSDFGIIPLPLMSETQEDYNTSIGYTVALTTTIPFVVKDMEMSKVVVDTMGAESHYSLNPVLYGSVLGDKLSRDEMSQKNLDIIFDRRFYDPGCTYNFANIASIMMKSWTEGAENVVSVIEANRPAVQEAIDKMVETLRAK